mmetsp:Transcript_8086/g.24110  ORF Transcript_8086/g.24110 Transcript_8086/m.24110 type:complete len:244 (-) Transcript_8086:1049-1780(-)
MRDAMRIASSSLTPPKYGWPRASAADEARASRGARSLRRRSRAKGSATAERFSSTVVASHASSEDHLAILGASSEEGPRKKSFPPESILYIKRPSPQTSAPSDAGFRSYGRRCGAKGSSLSPLRRRAHLTTTNFSMPSSPITRRGQIFAQRSECESNRLISASAPSHSSTVPRNDLILCKTTTESSGERFRKSSTRASFMTDPQYRQYCMAPAKSTVANISGEREATSRAQADIPPVERRAAG